MENRQTALAVQASAWVLPLKDVGAFLYLNFIALKGNKKK
jgi:hypothetical protein